MIRKIHVFIGVILIEIATGQNSPVVKTQNGLVRGRINSTVWNSIKYSSFRGIPFAKPPVRELRFQPPVPVDSWDGTWDATRHRNVCIQLDLDSSHILGEEDCLYLNVYTPNTNFTGPLSKKAVMFWIYGGGYISGSGNDDPYGPDYFMEQDVVVVTSNYRLAAFGFLALNSSRALGNQGLKDQYLALQWVNKNIAAFGGDPTKVLIFGESAGATSVGFHVLSKKAQGLFSTALKMSGSPLCPWAYRPRPDVHKAALEAAVSLGYADLGDAESVFNFLSTVPAKKLTEATIPLTYLLCSSFTPTIEDTTLDYNNTAYLTNCPISLYQSGNFNKVANLMGHTDNEMAFLSIISKFVTGNSTFDILRPSDAFTSTLSSVFNMITSVLSDGIIQVLSDLLFTAPIDLTQRLMNLHNDDKPIYYYLGAYKPPYAFNEMEFNITYQGVAHGDDISYVWYQPNIPVVRDPNNSFRQFQLKMVTMYTNFAKYGNPTPENDSSFGISWTPSGSQGYQLDINDTFKMVRRQLSMLSSTLKNFYSSLLPVTSECKP